VPNANPCMNRTILARWAYILGLATAVAGLCGAGLAYLSAAGFRNPLEPSYSALGPVFREALMAGVLLLGLALFQRVCPIRLGHLHTFLRYPPVWLAILAGLVAALGLDAAGLLLLSGQALPWADWPWLLQRAAIAGALLALFGGLPALASALAGWVSGRREARKAPETRTSPDEAKAAEDEWAALEAWLSGERPADEDLLGTSHVAGRFADLLLLPFGQDKTLGLVGEFGSGKSSIVRWIGGEVARRRKPDSPTVWLCHVSCWGFDDSASAVHHLLARAVATLEERVDCSALRRLPDAYRKVIASADSWSLLDAVLPAPDAEELLGRLTPILEAVDARLVVVVEDLDRNRSDRFDPQDVFALLQRLRAVRGVSFILTGGTEPDDRVAFAKLCDHVERVPHLGMDRVLETVRAVRKRCLDSHADLYPERGFGRPPGDGVWDGSRAAFAVAFPPRPDRLPVPYAAAALLATPRLVKHALRQVVTAWERLHGEVDLDDLLVLAVLRHAAPEAFDFLLRNADRLRAASRPPAATADAERSAAYNAALREEWAALTAGVAWDAPAARELVCFLFPGATQPLTERAYHLQDLRRQGVQNDSPTDYFDRALAGELDPGEVADQDALRAIRGWVGNPDSTDLACRVASDDRFAVVWASFGHLMPSDRFLAFARQVIDLLVARAGPGPVGEVAWAALRRLGSELGTAEAVHRDWLIEAIEAVLPRNLGLAVDLYHDWTEGRRFLAHPEERGAVRAAVVEAARRHFTEAEPAVLLGAIHPARPYTLYQLVFPPDGTAPPSRFQEPADWAWFAPAVLAAAQADPGKMVPELAYLVSTRGEPVRGQFQQVIHPERLEGLFGSSSPLVLDLLASIPRHLPEARWPEFRRLREQAVEMGGTCPGE